MPLDRRDVVLKQMYNYKNLYYLFGSIGVIIRALWVFIVDYDWLVLSTIGEDGKILRTNQQHSVSKNEPSLHNNMKSHRKNHDG